MIQKLFNIFLDTNPSVEIYEYEPNHDNDDFIAPIYSVKSYKESISNNIIDDIILYRDKIINNRLKEITGCTPEEYGNEYIYKEINHPTHTPKEYDDTYLKVSKKLEYKATKYAFDKHNILEEDLYEDILYRCDLESFAELIRIEIKKDQLYDAYGTGLYKVKDNEFVIFSTYDNGSDRNRNVYTTLCCYNLETFKFELADIMYEDGEFYLSEIQMAKMPKQLRHLHIENLSGKRSFRWKVKEKIVQFRSTKEFREVVAEKLNKEVDLESYKSFITFKLD